MMYAKYRHNIVLLSGICSLVWCQERQGVMESVLDRTKRVQDMTSIPITLPMDAPINATTYIVGPGDVFLVDVGLGVLDGTMVAVSPEGTLIIPNVGEVKVSDRTLNDAKKTIAEALKKKYVARTPTITLVRVRSVVVFVRGHVVTPGRTIVNAADRVEKAIYYANNQYDYDPNRAAAPSPEELEIRRIAYEYEKTMSQRNIVVRRRDGSVMRVDLTKYHATGDDIWNPGLMEGDEIIVPPLDGAHNTIGVYGGVNMPGRFEYVEGETLLDAVVLARGFSTRAIRDTLFLMRLSDLKTSLHQTLFPIQSESSRREAAKVMLMPGDRVFVKQERELRGDYSVTLEGEVQKPGRYPITREHTRLSDVVAMAEGFTEHALLSAAEVHRTPRAERLRERNMQLLQALGGFSAAEDSLYFRVEQQLRAEREVVAVNLERLFVNGDSLQELTVRDGDRIVIPSRGKTVYVFGQVVLPGHIAYMPGLSAEYYISRAGGYAQEALTGDIKIIKAASKQWLDPGDTLVEEGDLIWVPKEPYRPFSYYLGIVGQTASIIGGALTIVLLVLQLQK